MYSEPIGRQGERFMKMLRGKKGLCGGHAIHCGGADTDPLPPADTPRSPLHKIYELQITHKTAWLPAWVRLAPSGWA